MTAFDQHGNLHSSNGRFTKQVHTGPEVSHGEHGAPVRVADPDKICAGADEVTLGVDSQGHPCAEATYTFLGRVRLDSGEPAVAHTRVRLKHPTLEAAKRAFDGD